MFRFISSRPVLQFNLGPMTFKQSTLFAADDDSLANFSDSDIDPELLAEIKKKNRVAVQLAYDKYKERMTDPEYKNLYENPGTNLVEYSDWDLLDPPFGEDAPGRQAKLLSHDEAKTQMDKIFAQEAAKKKKNA